MELTLARGLMDSRIAMVSTKPLHPQETKRKVLDSPIWTMTTLILRWVIAIAINPVPGRTRPEDHITMNSLIMTPRDSQERKRALACIIISLNKLEIKSRNGCQRCEEYQCLRACRNRRTEKYAPLPRNQARVFLLSHRPFIKVNKIPIQIGLKPRV